MNASSTDSHRVCAFRFPCFVFREITASFSIIPSARTVIFIFWLQIPPGLNLSEIRAKGRGGLQPGTSRDCRPPWGPPESRPRRWEFRTAKRESRLRRPDFFTAKWQSRPPRPDFSTTKWQSRPPCSDFSTAKWQSRQRRSPLPGRAFSAARPAGTARFLITRGKASFYETATFGRRKVFFCSPFCGLLFCLTRAKLALPAGEKPAAPKPRPPRGGPAQRPRPAPGFCAASANARPGDPAPVRLLEKVLWVPPTTEPFRPAPSGKPERKKERRTPDETRTAALTTAPPEDGWEGSQPKRAQRRGKPAK